MSFWEFFGYYVGCRCAEFAIRLALKVVAGLAAHP